MLAISRQYIDVNKAHYRTVFFPTWYDSQLLSLNWQENCVQALKPSLPHIQIRFSVCDGFGFGIGLEFQGRTKWSRFVDSADVEGNFLCENICWSNHSDEEARKLNAVSIMKVCLEMVKSLKQICINESSAGRNTAVTCGCFNPYQFLRFLSLRLRIDYCIDCIGHCKSYNLSPSFDFDFTQSRIVLERLRWVLAAHLRWPQCRRAGILLQSCSESCAPTYLLRGTGQDTLTPKSARKHEENSHEENHTCRDFKHVSGRPWRPWRLHSWTGRLSACSQSQQGHAVAKGN